MASASKIVFLIDEQSIISGKVQLDHLKLSIMRILLYYRSQQQQVLWGYRFFSTQTRYSAHNVRHFYTMDSKESFSRIDQEYLKRNDDRPETAIIGAPIMRIKQALKEILGDFQWQNTDLSTSGPEKNYLFILTACPSNGIDMIRFFVTPVDDDDDDDDDDDIVNGSGQKQQAAMHTKKSTVESFEVSKYFQRLKDELHTTLLKSYQQCHISLNIIDTDFKFISSNAHTRFMNRLIHQGFVSCFDQFGGNYILYQKLIRRNDMYGHSFFAEFANILPSKRQAAVHTQVPCWKGPFKTKTGKSLGNFALYPSIRGANYQPSALAFIKEIRTVDVVHASQFSVSWLLHKSAQVAIVDYKFTYQQGESSSAFNVILDELYAKQSILIADLVPIGDYEHMARKVCIEPYSRCSASLRFLNVDNLPPTLHLKNVLVDQDYPIGSSLDTSRLGIDMPKAPLQPEHRTLSLFTSIPSFITKLADSDEPYSHVTQIDDQCVGTPGIRVEDIANPVVQFPATVDAFGLELKKTYLETLYTQEQTFIDATIIRIGKCIDYLLQNNHSRQDIIASIFDYTMPLADLDMKHHNEIPSAKNAPNSSNCTLEQTYQHAWWKEVKSRAHLGPDFERMSCIALKLREAQLQTINYCFICKLTNDPRQLEVYSRDPFEEARSFFSKVVVIFSMNDDISDFLASLDFEQGAQAIKKRDPCTLNDHAFAQVLAKRFSELPDMVDYFKESAGADDMASLPSLDLVDDILDDDNDFQLQQEPQPQSQPFTPLPQSNSSSSKPPRIESRTLSNTRIVKPNHPPKKPTIKATPAVNLEPKLAKTFMPQKMTRSSSNTLDSFYKRMVNLAPPTSTSHEPQRGEATKESIAKMKRAAVHGKATMKRAGSFTKSALSPRRPKRSVSMLSQAPQETGTVILRRDNSIPNPETTPRTSLNRYLGTNLFADYSEACPSPTSRTSPTTSGVAAGSAYLQSEYPQAPKTPQGTSSRFRKIMMDRTPHRHENDQNDLEEFSVSLNSQENHLPPYTPRTAARRERDRIDRSEGHPARDLTMRFQIIKKEEEIERNKPVVKRKRDIFAEDDDDDDEDDEEDVDQENTNPLSNSSTFTATTASRPVVKRSKTFDFNDFYNNALDTPPIQFGQALTGIDDDDDDDDSDDLDGYFGLGGR
ncbi:hypothetical protein MAM1_0157d06837 [Mucor ambiguus]|uniref:Treslin N-terminal domain-containing protein n=1 Tax=Mucor ambiguus TaxID=91626 RepID=A0A0C9MA41_9FUNG|nr:hypothetical protein MAM1_0157d06837 [Mucor ambiguus]